MNDVLATLTRKPDRGGDRLLLHGSTGAGAFRQLAAGAKVAVCGFLVDGLVIAQRQFDHSANYRSAVVRGICRVLGGDEKAWALDLFTDTILPGRVAECPPHSTKELAQTLLLALPITADNWVAKRRTGPAASSESAWTGVIPMTPSYREPVSNSTLPVPPSVARLVSDR
jgi:nitroimidazol reductase NimA-like FMN-containing flavoprotein (pyridoxamine 5'-phosphate oxidase superfamily)